MEILQFSRNLSIKNKIVAIILFVSFTVISIGFTIIATWDIKKLKSDIQSNLALDAKLIGDYCIVPLTFGDSIQAAEALSRLKLLESVEAGSLYDETGKLFATYLNTIKEISITNDQNVIFKDKHIYIKEPIVFQGKTLGVLILKANTKSLENRKRNHTLTIVSLILVLALISYFLAVKMQKFISAPILRLAELTASISKSQDFTVQLQPQGNDEVGFLYKQFNRMMSQLLRWEIERDLAEKEIKFLAHVLKNVNECVSITDINNKITFVNQSFLKTYGYNEEELVGQSILILRSLNNPPEIIDEIQPSTLKGGWQGELLNKRKDGREFPILLTTTVIFDNENQPVALVGVSTDITERKKVENELALHRDHLEELIKQRTIELEIEKEHAQSADRLKSAFLATMSHELRTPLNSIIGFTGIIMQELPGPLNTEQKKQLGMAQQSARHLLSLINDVLDISKIEAGQLKMTIEQFELSEVILKVVEASNPLAEKKNLRINVSISPDVKDIKSDKLRVQQVLINLVNNAIKFTEAGSISIECYKTNNYVTIKVIDSGIGIEKEQMRLLFKPFSQIDTGLTRKHEGTGLGLSICKKLLDMLNGSIDVVSEANVGSTFIVRLPINNT